MPFVLFRYICGEALLPQVDIWYIIFIYGKVNIWYIIFMKISSEQVKAARALLRIEQAELAALSGISLPTIGRLEMQAGELKAYQSTVDAIVAAFEKAGVEFLQSGQTSLGGAGVRLK